MPSLILLLAVAAAGRQAPPAAAAEPDALAGSTTAQAQIDPEVRDIYRIFESASKLGTSRFKRILEDYKKMSEESQAEVSESLHRQIELDDIAEKYHDAKDEAEKKALRRKAQTLLEKAFDEQLQRDAEKARMHREEARRLEEEAAKRKSRRSELIERKLNEALSEGDEDWQL